MKAEEVARLSGRVLEAVQTVIVGKEEVLRTVFAAVLARGHVLMEDYPGLAKTLTAESFAQAMDIRFTRIQFTPDLLPADITGGTIYDRQEGRLVFAPGPIFSHLVLADEINRATPKTQSALLEAMQERQVTTEGKRHELEEPFLVFATQNPIEFEGTYPLPEAQMDRFIIRVSLGYPTEEEEVEMLLRRARRARDEVSVEAVITRDELLEMQRAVEEVYVSPEVAAYVARLVGVTRGEPRLQLGSSPRGTLALFKLARAWAAMDGRDFVTPEDVKRFVEVALAHRLILEPEHWVRGEKEGDVVQELAGRVPAPRALEPGDSRQA